MTEIISITDLPPEIQQKSTAQLMVDGANAQAARVAPCLFWTGTPEEDPAPSAGQLSEAKLLLLGSIVRWTKQDGGGLQQQTAGPFSMGLQTTNTGYRLWPSEITQLQDICSNGDSAPTIGHIDTAPGLGYGHLPWCDWMFNNGTSCSCGLWLAGRPIYENAPGL